MAAVCWKCVEDEYLKEIVHRDGHVEQCSICNGEAENAFDPEDFAPILDPILREHIELGEDVKRFAVENDDEWWEQEGEPLSDRLQEVIGQYLGFEDEIVEALVDYEDARWQDGDDGFYHDDQSYVSTPATCYRIQSEWDDALADLKHRRRFFSAFASGFFQTLFEDVETRQWWNSKDRRDDHVVIELPQGAEIFRARICDSVELIKDAFVDPLKHVGPPPAAKARPGRMNAEGVVVFYGALDLETCIAETRPALGSDIAVIRVQCSKALRLLDFKRLGESYRHLSYFQPDFSEEVEKGVFLRRLQRLISQPIIPGREAEYVITQAMAEYLAHVHEDPFAGIVFDSVQKSEGTNVVLFPDANGEFPVAYVNESIELYSTKSIQLSHSKRCARITEEGDLFVSGFDDEL
jgi:hypothetical protein